MKNAVLLVLLMSLSVLSGCISGDDGELQVEVSDEQIDSIVDEYFTDFVNNTSIIVNDYTTSGTNTTNNYYSNGSFSSSEQLFVVDFFFNKSDYPANIPQQIDYINRTFEVNYSTYNYSTNQDNEGVIELSCSGYYLIGLLTENPISFWESSSNYSEAWDNTYNSTVADLYYEYRYSTYVRNICDDTAQSSSLPGSTELIELYTVEIPQGKAIQCVTPLVVRQLWVEEGYYSTAYGEEYYTTGVVPGTSYQYRYQTTLQQNWDNMLGYTCGEYPLGSGDRDTNLTISVEDRDLDSSFNYRIYMVYKLIDVNAHVP